jgi:hypothetical protein
MMTRSVWLATSVLSLAVTSSPAARQATGGWTDDFSAVKPDLVATGRNPYFLLAPGYTLTLANDAEQLVITVLRTTRVVDGVTVSEVEERETRYGKLVEVSRNFYAISRRTNSVYYFGEEVDVYRDGRIVGHEGSWLAGVDGARFGLMMPGLPLVGARYYQEVAPKRAMDRAEIVSATAHASTPAGAFTHVVETRETTPLEPDAAERKRYAPGIGLIEDGDMRLTRRSGG